jgi:hypothetical protein
VEEGHPHQSQTYQDREFRHGNQHSVRHGHENEGKVESASQQPGSQRQVDSAQGSDLDPNRDQPSPGLLDPYRVKNGPVHHDPSDASSKPLPDLPEASVQKIAGHKILTTEDSSGHTRLHKEPKDSKRNLH